MLAFIKVRNFSLRFAACGCFGRSVSPRLAAVPSFGDSYNVLVCFDTKSDPRNQLGRSPLTIQ